MSDLGNETTDRAIEAVQNDEVHPWARAMGSPGPVNRVIHGPNEFNLDLSGWTVGHIKEVHQPVLNCSYFAVAFINGQLVSASAVLKPGQAVEFLREFGFKGSGTERRDVREARTLLNGYPEIVRLVNETLGRTATVGEQAVAAVVLNFCVEKFGRPTQEAIPVLEELVRQLTRTTSNLRDDRIINASLNDSDRAIIEALRIAGHRLTTMKLLDTFVAAKNSPSDSTAKGHLASLVKRGILTKCRKCRPQGYGLPGWNHNCLDPVWTD